MPHLLGLTGNIACGKSTVGKQLLDLGAARYIDADALVHELYAPGQSVAADVAAAFGPSVLTPDGQIDRRALGAVVFGDPAQLRKLEAIVHPAVEVLVAERLADLPPDAVAVVDAVKLLEGGLGNRCDAVWLVTCAPAEQRRRLIEDRHMSPAEADIRLAAQPDEQARRALVDVVIDNSGTLEETRALISASWAAFRAKLGLA